tara:strand:- start:808 stop:1815 length:1008 start_codon:yes stop_codon:yes gene_type:complete
MRHPMSHKHLIMNDSTPTGRAMNPTSDATKLLDRVLPETFDLPRNQEGKVNFELDEIGLLSMRNWSDIDETLIGYGARHPFQQMLEINPLQTLADWGEIREHYYVLRSEAVDGFGEALNDLGWLWLNVETPTFRALANRLLRLAAREGSFEALYNLGEQYLAGRGVSPDLLRALEYFQKASGDLPEASLKLGMLYEYGHHSFPNLGVDVAESMKWYRQAHVDGDCWGSYYLSSLALKINASDREVAVAIFDLQELAMMDTLISMYASEGLAMHYLTQGMGEYQPLHIFWRDHAIALGSYWAKELKAQEDAPPEHPVPEKKTVRLTLVPEYKHGKK